MKFEPPQRPVFAFCRQSARSTSSANPKSEHALPGGTGGGLRQDAAPATPTDQRCTTAICQEGTGAMNHDENNIIDVEAEEIRESDCLPAVIPPDASNSEAIELPNRQDTLLADNPERRCVATNSRGERCRKFAIYGSTVCRTHGGATKRVKGGCAHPRGERFKPPDGKAH